MANPSSENSLPDRSTSYPFSQAGHFATPQSTRCDRVTQDELQQLYDLGAQIRLLRAHWNEGRAKVITKLQRNVPVEYGERQVKLIMSESRYLSAKSLLPLLGKEEVERLRTRVQPKINLLLRIG
jgi:hypothetical protein